MELLSGYSSGTTADLQELADELTALTKALDAAVSQVADAARNDPKVFLLFLLLFLSCLLHDVWSHTKPTQLQALGGAANLTASTMPPILRSANNAAAKTTEAEASENILGVAKRLADDTTAVLHAAKGLTANPNDYHRDQQLAQTVKGVKEDIRDLLKAVDAAIPGKSELLDALERINAAIARFLHPSAPRGNPQVRDHLKRRFLCVWAHVCVRFVQMHLKEVTDAARALADSVGRIVASARNFPEKLGPYSKQAADSVSEIVDAAKDASSGTRLQRHSLQATRGSIGVVCATHPPALLLLLGFR